MKFRHLLASPALGLPDDPQPRMGPGCSRSHEDSRVEVQSTSCKSFVLAAVAGRSQDTVTVMVWCDSCCLLTSVKQHPAASCSQPWSFSTCPSPCCAGRWLQCPRASRVPPAEGSSRGTGPTQGGTSSNSCPAYSGWQFLALLSQS